MKSRFRSTTAFSPPQKQPKILVNRQSRKKQSKVLWKAAYSNRLQPATNAQPGSDNLVLRPKACSYRENTGLKTGHRSSEVSGYSADNATPSADQSRLPNHRRVPHSAHSPTVPSTYGAVRQYLRQYVFPTVPRKRIREAREQQRYTPPQREDESPEYTVRKNRASRESAELYQDFVDFAHEERAALCPVLYRCHADTSSIFSDAPPNHTR